MKYIPFSINSGKYNMEFDEKLLKDAINSQTNDIIFRLYGWKPACISLGRNQKDTFINNEVIDKYNIDIVKRLTGGRALLHDNEITYSVITHESNLKKGSSVIESYKELSQILINVFETIGIKLTFGGEKPIDTNFDYCMLISTGADLCYNGKKFIGSAQCRKNGYILQHGSILLDYNKELLEEVFGEKITINTITSLKEINPNLTSVDIIKAFEDYIL